MTALLIITIVFCGIMFLVDTAIAVVLDDEAGAVAFFNLLVLALAIVTLSVALA